jgi:hypothetical protein
MLEHKVNGGGFCFFAGMKGGRFAVTGPSPRTAYTVIECRPKVRTLLPSFCCDVVSPEANK